jgi:signal transduction histidine kinase/DNA-binding response OmpR family regulator
MQTIMVVDDEKVIRDGCNRVLSAENFQVLTAANGQEALELLDCNTVDLVICDLLMPIMGAFEVLDSLRSSHPCLPLIVLTGHGTVTNAVECMKMGAYDFVTKPFIMDHLLLIVRRALEKNELEHRARQLQEERERHLYDLATEQSRTRTIINCMAEGVLVTNRNLDVVLHNPALMRLLDMEATPAPPISLSDYISDPALVEVIGSIVSMDSGEHELISRELSRGKVHLRAVSAPVYGHPDQVIGSVTVFHEITKFKELDELKSHFIRMVSHELRSPLSTIKQQIGVLLEGLAGELGEKQKNVLDRADERIGNLLELVNDLLDVAKIESGQCVLEQVPMRIDNLLLDMAVFMKARAESHGIELCLDIAPDLPQVLADFRSMEEVFGNLISNAVNYSPDGGRITISASPLEVFIEVRVSDTGIGIAAEELPKIFDKFYRARNPRTRNVVGTGLGLVIVKGIIESHRGSIQVDSEPGIGTTFRILLPKA